MKRHIIIVTLALSAAASWAQQTPAASPQTASGAQSAAMVDGEVRKVDKEHKKVTIKHGEIKNLDMPPMTMVFGVSKPELLDTLKVGDKVRFRAMDSGGGALVVTEIQAAQ